MIGRPVRINWRKEDTPETLKAAYLAQKGQHSANSASWTMAGTVGLAAR